jgi:hypothetical protein
MYVQVTAIFPIDRGAKYLKNVGNMAPVYIRCKVHRGLFETEYYVLVNGSSAYYINRRNVKVSKPPTGDESVTGKVFGYLIQRKASKSLVQLTGEVVVGGLRTWVDNTALVPA